MGTYKNTIETITKRLKKDTGCWEWTGWIENNGYGRVSINSKNALVHKVVYEALVGEIPEGLTLDHLCKVRHCVNPDHLEVVTLQENVLRGSSPVAINAKKTKCDTGHDLSTSNVYMTPNGRRQCRECQNRRSRAWYRKNKLARAN